MKRLVRLVLALWTSLAFALQPQLRRRFCRRLGNTLASGRENVAEWSLKRYPQDFIVIEDGCLSLLGTSMEVLPPTEGELAESEAARRIEEVALNEVQLEKLLSGDQRRLLQSMNSGSENARESVVLELKLALTKVQRRYFHTNLRNNYAHLESKTEVLPGQTAPIDCTRIMVHRKGTKSIAAHASGGVVVDDDRDRHSSNGKKKGKRKALVQRWDSSKPEYLHFTLSKHLMTSDEALELLSKRTGLLPTRFAVSGSKDKFAITAQRVSAWRMEREVLDKYMTEMEGRKYAGLPVQLSVSDVVPAKRPLSLGSLKGNLFVVTLRPSHGIEEEEATHALISSLQSQWTSGQVPFLNVFGQQRFGSPLGINVEVGRAVLQEDYRKAVLLLLLCPSTSAEVQIDGSLDPHTLTGWLQGGQDGGGSFWSLLQDRWADYSVRTIKALDDLEEQGVVSERVRNQVVDRHYFLSQLLRGSDDLLSSRSFAKSFLFSQRRLVENIVEQLRKEAKQQNAADQEIRLSPSRIDFKKAFSQALPRNLRQLFVNALQSHIFNAQCEEVYGRLERERGECRSSVLKSQMQRHGALEGDLVLRDVAGAPLSAWDVSERNITMTANAVPVYDASRNVDSSNGKSATRRAYVHTVTQNEANSRAFGLECVLGVLPGSATAAKGRYKEMIGQGCDALTTASHSDGLYRMPGAYRHIISSARNFRACRSSSSDPRETRAGVSTPLGQNTERGKDSGHRHGDSFSSTVEELASSGKLAALISQLQSTRVAPKRGGEEEGGREERPQGPGVELTFSLCASSYATSFTDCLVQQHPKS